MQKILMGDEFRTRPVWAEDLVPGDVVNLKGGPAIVYGVGELLLSDRVVLGLKDVAACEHYPRTREIIVPAGMVFPTFLGRAEGY